MLTVLIKILLTPIFQSYEITAEIAWAAAIGFPSALFNNCNAMRNCTGRRIPRLKTAGSLLLLHFNPAEVAWINICNPLV